VRALDVLVVGLGPAGVAAAVTARDHGLTVRAVDKATFPRDKTCGDGLTAAALRRMEDLGVDVRTLPGCARVDETVLVAPDGREVRLPMPPDGLFSVVVPRVELDAALVARTRARGVAVTEGAAEIGRASCRERV